MDLEDFNRRLPELSAEWVAKRKIPQPPKLFSWIYACPSCGKILSANDHIDKCECGQLLVWR